MEPTSVLSAPFAKSLGGGSAVGRRAAARRATENSSGEEFFSLKESSEWRTSRQQEHEQASEEKSQLPIKVEAGQIEAGRERERSRRDNRGHIWHERPAGDLESRLSFFEKRPAASDRLSGGPTTGATVSADCSRRSSLLEALIGGGRSWPEEKTVIVEIRNGRRVEQLAEPSSVGGQVSSAPKATEQLQTNNPARADQPGPREQPAALALEKSSSNEKRPPSRQEVEIAQAEEEKEKKDSKDSKDSKKTKQPEAEREATGRGQAKGKKPPSFGSTPSKLTRLPYFSYFGKARNVSLVSSADREPAQETSNDRYSKRDNSSTGSGSSNSNSPEGSSSSRSTSLLSRIPTVLAVRGSRKEEAETKKETARRSSSLVRGYSNISNLFPGKPMSVRGGGAALSGDRRYAAEAAGEFAPEARYGSGRGRRQQSSSLLNLNQIGGRTTQLAGGKRAQSASRFANDHLSRTNSSTNNAFRYRNSSQMPRDYIDDDDHEERAAMRRPAKGPGRFPRHAYNQGRPASAAAGYLAARPGHFRSPSANSLYYGGGGGGGSAGMSPYGLDFRTTLDPDCPVHGYSSPPPPAGRDTHQTSLGKGNFEPELLYDPYPARADDEGYFEHRGSKAAGSPYSPSSPPMQAGRPAYYNSASRFSVFHSPEAGARASLAAPQEQLRRILGYQPHAKPIHLHPQWAYTRPFIHLQGSNINNRSLDNLEDGPEVGSIKPRFEPFNQLHDAQAIRAVDFHPSGEVYAVGSNSRALRICAYPADHQLRHFNPREHVTGPPRVLFKFLQVHRGSIYCVRFNSTGQLLATGSNDQTVHIVRYNSATHSPDGDEFRLSMHDGTVRDLCFVDDSTNGSSLLLSAGGGDNKIYVTDCDTITPFQSMAGHTQMVMALDHWSGASFVSASYDRTIRFWDLRTRNCTSIVSAPASAPKSASYNANRWWQPPVGPGAPACSVKVDPSGRLLASGHADSSCMLYDIRGARLIQSFRAHEDELRTVSFSPKSYYLLTGGYDGRILLTDLQGDLTQPLPSVCVAESDDKIVQSSWHPSDFAFVATGADKTATLWALPGE